MLTSGKQDYKKLITVICAGTIVLACITLLGWFLNIDAFKKIISSSVAMKFNTAICFILISASLLLQLNNRLKAGRISAVIAGVIALLTVSQQVFNNYIGIDELLYPDNAARQWHYPYPGRMSALAALCFIFMAVGLLIFKSKRTLLFTISQWLFHLVTVFGFIILLCYLFDVHTIYSLAPITSMALNTSFAFMLFSVAASLVNASIGITGLFTGTLIGNVMARRQFFLLAGIIIVLGYMRIESHKFGILSVEAGIAAFAFLFISACLFITWKTARSLNKIDIEKSHAMDFFRLAIEAAPSGFIMTDKTKKIILVNSQAEAMFGYTREEIVGQPLEILIPHKFREGHPANVNGYMAAPEVRYFGGNRDLRAIRKNGEEFPVEIGLNPVYTNGETLILSSIIDISERKKSESIITNQLNELTIKNKELEQFTYIASHDLQEPLRTVSNFLQIIEEDHYAEFNSDVKFYLDTINAATSRMSILIRSLLDFARLGANKELSLTNCNTLVNNVLADLTSLITKTHAQIVVNPLPEIYVYETELRQVFQNLINNAIKFRKDGATPVIEIGYEKLKNKHQFYVADNGIGIDPKYFNRIFKIFQRLNKADDFEGHGIGLANCSKIIQLHQGKIWVESEPGNGSTFKFTIKNFKP